MIDGPTGAGSSSDDQPRLRLARAMAARRRELGLSTTDAASRAGVARNTWMTAESGARAVRDQNFAGIEDALAWAPGSVSEVLSGGEPTAAERRPDVSPTAGERHGPRPDVAQVFDLQVEVERIRHLDLPAEARLRLIRDVIDLYEEVARESAGSTPPRGGASRPS